jgi:signal transduction histidine kinase
MGRKRNKGPLCCNGVPDDPLARLTRRNAELEQVIHVTSHDLRSPLVNVQGFSRELSYSVKELQNLLDETDVPADFLARARPLLDEQIPESLSYILASTAKMDSLLTSLLHVSRVGRAVFVFEPLDMGRLVREVLQNFEYRLKETGVLVEVEELPPCVGDSRRINQVFSNLLENSLKFLDPARPGHIRVGGEVRTCGPTYFVEDNGIGIPEAHRASVFDLFFTLAPERGGEGLGLAVVRRIIDKHGGRIYIESTEGAGCTISLSIPSGKPAQENC